MMDTENSVRESPRKCFNCCSTCFERLRNAMPVNGALYAMIAGTTNAAEQVLGKFLTNSLGPNQIFLYRLAFQTPITILVVALQKQTLIPAVNEKKYLVIRCVSYNCHVICSYISFLSIPYLDSIVISAAMCCIFSLILAAFILSEKINLFTFAMIVMIISGVVIICKPSFLFGVENLHSNTSSFYIGTLWAAASGVNVSITSLSNRYLQKTSPATCSLYVTVSGLLMAIIGTFIPIERKFSFEYDVILISFGCGCLGVIILITWAKALQVGELLESVLALQIEIPAGAIFQFLIMKTFPDVLGIIGVVLVVVGVMCVTIQSVVVSMLNVFDSL